MAIRSAGLTDDFHFVSSSMEDIPEVIQAIFKRKNPPSALFCCSNIITRRVLPELLKLKIRTLDDVALVGFDDFEMADILHRAITVVRQPVDSVGRAAAELLFSRIADEKKIYKTRHMVLPVELVVRDFCGEPR